MNPGAPSNRSSRKRQEERREKLIKGLCSNQKAFACPWQNTQTKMAEIIKVLHYLRWSLEELCPVWCTESINWQSQYFGILSLGLSLPDSKMAITILRWQYALSQSNPKKRKEVTQ